MTAKLKMKKEKEKEKTSREPRPMETWEIQRSVAEAEQETRDTLEFLRAVDDFKRRTDRSFPTWTEILQILKSLGYRKG